MYIYCICIHIYYKCIDVHIYVRLQLAEIQNFSAWRLCIDFPEFRRMPPLDDGRRQWPPPIIRHFLFGCGRFHDAIGAIGLWQSWCWHWILEWYGNVWNWIWSSSSADQCGDAPTRLGQVKLMAGEVKCGCLTIGRPGNWSYIPRTPGTFNYSAAQFTICWMLWEYTHRCIEKHYIYYIIYLIAMPETDLWFVTQCFRDNIDVGIWSLACTCFAHLELFNHVSSHSVGSRWF